MASDDDYRAEQLENPKDVCEQPMKVCKRNGEHSSSPVRKGVHGSDGEGPSRSYMAKGAKKRGRGRPVIYEGDPDAPGLDPEHRRLLQRRISNRESARRTRERHQEQAASLYAKAKSLHQNCKVLAAQVDALKLKCSKSEALEKELTEVLRIRDEQMEAFKRKSNSLQKVINKLTLRLYSKEQEMQLRMHFAVDGCGPAINTQPATLQSADVPLTSGSGSQSQIWAPFPLSESAAERTQNRGWPPYMSPFAGQAADLGACANDQARPMRAMSVHAPCEFVSQVACQPPQPLLTDMDMGLPEPSSSSGDADSARANFFYMVTELGLLPNGESSTKTTTP